MGLPQTTETGLMVCVRVVWTRTRCSNGGGDGVKSGYNMLK